MTFQGVPYTPQSALAGDCACEQGNAKKNTVVAIDAQTGALVADLGADQ